MCNLYAPSIRDKISMKFAVAAPVGDYAATVAPLKPGPFVIAGRALVGQWGMIPAWSKTRVPMLPNGQRLSTNNARCERLSTAPTYRNSWLKSRRCLIPADSFDEPYWGTGKNIWWRFWRADGEPWFIAADACKALGLTNVTRALDRLDADEITLIDIQGASNGLPVNVVSESGLYSLILRSDKPQAKPVGPVA